MTIGNIAVTNPSVTFEPGPKPNQTTRIGASATFGTAWNATSIG
jgi:hypothetical protein